MSEMSVKQAESVLGVSGFYTEADVKKAYRDLIKKNHPDVQPKDEASQKAASKKMVEINDANKVLMAYVKKNPVRRVTPVTWSTPSATTTQQTYTPPTSTYSYQPPSTPKEEVVEESKPQEVAKDPLLYRIIHGIASHFPYRIAFVVFAVVMYQWRTGNSILYPFVGIDASVPMEAERTLFYFGMFIVSILNLFTGLITIYLRESVLWAIDKVAGKAAPEPSLLYDIFGHLPYRLMFMGFAIWWYWDYGMFHVADSGPFDWPLRCIVVLIANLNCLLPIITNFIRDLLAGDPY